MVNYYENQLKQCWSYESCKFNFNKLELLKNVIFIKKSKSKEAKQIIRAMFV